MSIKNILISEIHRRKLLILFIFLTLLFTISLYGCTVVLIKSSDIYAFDASIQVKVYSSQVNQTINMAMKMSYKNNNIEASIVSGNQQTYILNNKVYVVEEGEVISCDTYKDFNDPFMSNQMLIKINTFNNKYDKTVKDDGFIEYTFTLSEQDARVLLGLSALNLSMFSIESCDMVMTVDPDTKYPYKVEIKSILIYSQQRLYLDYYITYNKFNEDVKIDFSSAIEEYEFDLLCSDPATDPYTNNYVETNNDDKYVNITDNKVFPSAPSLKEYEDKADGISQLLDYSQYYKAFYDDVNNYLIIVYNQRVEIFFLETMELVHTITPQYPISAMDTDNGLLALAFGKYKKVNVYDLSKKKSIASFSTDIIINDLIIDDDNIYYSDGSSLIKYNMVDKSYKLIDYSMNLKKMEINKKENILYLSRSRLIYIDSITGTKLMESNNTSYYDNIARFDGKNVHFSGRIFASKDKLQLSSTNCIINYPEVSGQDSFIPKATIYDGDEYDVVAGDSDKIGIYSHQTEKFIYIYNFVADKIYPLSNDRFLLTDFNGRYILLINLNSIQGSTLENTYNVDFDNSIKVGADGYKRISGGQYYRATRIDDEYLYLLNGYSGTLNIFNASTFEFVKSIRFTNNPSCISIEEGRIAVGFGNAYQIWYYDNYNAEPEIINTNFPVNDIILYKNDIIFSNKDQHCFLLCYNLNDKTTKNVLNIQLYALSIDINRDDGILYFASAYASSYNKDTLYYYNLNEKAIILEINDRQNSSSISFDGNYVHYSNRLYNKTTGGVINPSGCKIEIDNQYTNKKLVYRDEMYAVINYHTNSSLIYDINNETVLITLPFKISKVFKYGDAYIVVSAKTKDIYYIPTNLN